MLNYPNSSFPAKNNILNTIAETSLESHTEMSDIEGSRMQKGHFQNPIFQQKESISSQFLSSGSPFSGGLTNQPSYLQTNTNFQSGGLQSNLNFQKTGTQPTTEHPFSAYSTGFSQFNKKPESEFGNTGYDPTNQGTSPYNQAGGGDSSTLTDDTGDLSHMSLGNFKKAFHNKDNSYNLNLTKMDESTINQSQMQQKRLENQGNIQGNAFSNNAAAKMNYSAQPVDLLNFVNSNTYGINMPIPNTVTKDPAQNLQKQFSSDKFPEDNQRYKNRTTETRELESLLAQLDPLELSEIAPLSENFLDDDVETTPTHLKLMKKHSKAPEDAVKPKEEPKVQQSVPEPVPIQNYQTNYTPTSYNFTKEETNQYTSYSVTKPDNNQYFPKEENNQYTTYSVTKPDSNQYPSYSVTKPDINPYLTKEENNQYTSYSVTQPDPNQYPSYSVTKPDIISQAPLSFPSQEGIKSYTTANSQVTFRPLGSSIDPKPPVTTSVESAAYTAYGSSNLSTSPYKSEYLPNLKSSDIYLQPQNLYASEPKESVYQVTYVPPIVESQYSSTTNLGLGSYQNLPRSNNTSPRPSRPESAYQSTSTNYTSSLANVQNQSMSQNPVKTIRQSQIALKEYHNPFSGGGGSNYQSNQSVVQHNFQSNLSVNDQYQTTMGMRSASPYQERDLSPKRVEEEAGEIVNKMQTLYKDWRQKNEELNSYLNDLVHTAATQDVTVRKTVHDFPGQRNSATSTSKPILPHDFRYSVNTPNYNGSSANYRENFQNFMKEELLKGVDQPDDQKTQVKPVFKKFTNPIFEKSPQSRGDISVREMTGQRNSTHEESIYNQSASRNTLQNPQRSYQEQEPRKTFPFSNYGSEPSLGNVSSRKTPEDSYAFQPKYTEHNAVNYRSVSPPQSERVTTTERESHKTKFNFPVNNYKAGYEHFKRRLFGYNVKKNRFIEGVDERKINVSQVEVLCDNCQGFVKADEAEKHYELCCKTFRKKVRNMKSLEHDDLNELNSQLAKIRQKIVNKLSTLQIKKLIEIKVKQILRYVDTAIYQDDNLKELGFLINESERLIEEVSQENLGTNELALVLYLDRFIYVAKAKFAEVQSSTLNELEQLEMQGKIFEYEREMPKQQIELNALRVQMMMNIQLRSRKNLYFVKAPYVKEEEVLSQINSDIASLPDDSFDDLSDSVATSVAPLKEEQPIQGKSPFGNPNPNSEANKIKFYSMVVNDKLLLPPSHPGKDLLISDLYDECLRLNLPEHEWQAFIRKKLGL